MINVCYCGNAAMFDGIMMSLVSMSDNTVDALDVFILTGDFTAFDPKFTPFSEKQASFLEKCIRVRNEKSRVSVIDAKPYFDKDLSHSPNARSFYSPYSMLRLFLDLLPNAPEKIVYLDADTIVMKDIDLLYYYDLGDKLVGAVRDAVGRYCIYPNYINTGVLLINLKDIKKEGTFAKCRTLLSHQKLSFPDQDAINRYTHGRKKFLPRVFNEQKRLSDKTVIRHYCNQPRIFPKIHAMIAKPWNIDQIHDVYHIAVHDALWSRCQTLKKEFENE